MEEIIIDDYFIELTDEGRGTIGYSLIGWKTNELMDKIFSLNKAYKRKEKECEELKEKLKTLDNSVITYLLTESDLKKYNKLKQSLKEINEELEQLNKLHDEELLRSTILIADLTKKEKALKEIKEICKKAIDIYNNNNFYEDDRDIFMAEANISENLLQIINEAENVSSNIK